MDFQKKPLDIYRFLELGQMYPVLDVRSPGEYIQGHIPGAINLPLFTDQERAIVGTTYKQQGRNQAILKGLDFAGPKLATFLRKAEKAQKKNSSQGNFLIHCKRGGLRSQCFSWLLNLYGMQVQTLEGGYKSFRNFILKFFKTKIKLIILGGFTGSAKTKILHFLKSNGEQIIDLENLACHKGSAFGSLGERNQPTQEQFENSLALKIFNTSRQKSLWLEDESQMLGKIRIPNDFWRQMRDSPVIFMQIPYIDRKKNIENEYGKFDTSLLKNCIDKIQKKLGREKTTKSLFFLDNGDIGSAIKIALDYYDKMYNYSLSKRNSSNMYKILFSESNAEMNAKKILAFAATKLKSLKLKL